MKLSPCSGLLAYCYGNSWPAELRRILMWTPSTSRCSSCRGGGCCSPSSALMPCECAHIQYAEVNLNGKPVRVQHFFSKGFLILIAEHLLLWYVKCWPISERVTGSVKKTFSLDTVEFFQFSLEHSHWNCCQSLVKPGLFRLFQANLPETLKITKENPFFFFFKLSHFQQSSLNTCSYPLNSGLWSKCQEWSHTSQITS